MPPFAARLALRRAWTVASSTHYPREHGMGSILGISGSLRTGSLNTALLRAAAGLAPQEVAFDIATLHGIPLYDGDAEAASGLPDAVLALKDRWRAADGVVLATPEYNNGIPGVFKNAIDWLSRPSSDIAGLFGGKPVAVIGASPGGFGTVLAQDAWWPVLRTLRVRPWFGGRLMVSRAGGVFDDAGHLTDARLRAQLGEFIAGFAAFVRAA
jgi:chromate reductase, NAD(P)H dehydrogenase (quinone)